MGNTSRLNVTNLKHPGGMAAAQGLPVPGPRCAAGRRRACKWLGLGARGPQVASLEAAGGGLLTRRSTRRAAPNSASSRSALSCHQPEMRALRVTPAREPALDLPQHLRTSMPVGTSRAPGAALAAPVRRVSNDAVRDIRRSLLVAACTPDANYTRTLRLTRTARASTPAAGGRSEWLEHVHQPDTTPYGMFCKPACGVLRSAPAGRLRVQPANRRGLALRRRPPCARHSAYG
jgi:hypothetical protein